MILRSATHPINEKSAYDFDILFNSTGYEQRSSALVKHGVRAS